MIYTKSIYHKLIIMSNTISSKNPAVRIIAVMLAVVMALVFMSPEINASAAAKKVTVAAPKLISEAKYDSSATHPYNKQMSAITVRWNKVAGATQYRLYIQGGKYKSWKLIKNLSAKTLSYTVTGLKRATTYKFALKAVKGKVVSKLSAVQSIKTARINFDSEGWKAICRIVYHEVGRASGSVWDKSIVYVSDAVVNRFVAAKISKIPTWANQYRRYSNIQSMIYNSGEFMSSAGLTRDGAVYSKVPSKVKLAVYGALYAKTTYKNIANKYDVYFWCNTGYRPSGKKVSYTMTIPWGGYFSVWNSYWG
ncbi:MAG: fibronectin type III domain-containing protein [Oscillospiraceae bacterium]